MQCIAPWIPAFKNGLTSETEKFITFSFSTIDSKKLIPRNRTCVYRGFLFNDESTNSIIFTTDNRSIKFDELSNNNNFEACFYFKSSSKQFRFSGKAQILNPAKEIFPNIILPDIVNKPYEEDEDHDDYEEVEEAESADRPVLHKSGSTVSVFKFNNNNKKEIIDDDLNYPIFSPSSLTKIQNNLENIQITLQELLLKKPEILYPPTKEDYNIEFERCWNILSSKSKSNFKNPRPKTLMTEEKRKMIDRIARGVDGKSINDGKKNCSVVILLIDKVDYYKDSYGNSKRLIYERINFDQWKESEVVP